MKWSKNVFISFIIETRISVTESWFLPLKGAEFAPLWPTQSLPLLLPLHLFQLFFATTTTGTATAPFLIFFADILFLSFGFGGKAPPPGGS